ncbi:MAG: C_GCAxxG_C_C family protein [Calditrichaceae bacterium]|nr:C_GCAxxG_C_C family protein [Calditrichaceae bacterium]MBN2710417.1 C_GCAxxG_C_C family protein [Calditrichaceae bacterium]RQV94587.1 MAG: C_GCAxxG_C_C family protein [Calditrichota bacterium]
MIPDKCINTYLNGYNCAQAVLKPFAEEYGLDDKTASKIASVFGGGMARMQATCGAVTGAFMAIGLKYGFTNPGEDQDKKLVLEKSKNFIELFQKEFGSLNCIEFLECDLNTEEGQKIHNDENQRELICAKLVKRAAEIVESL